MWIRQDQVWTEIRKLPNEIGHGGGLLRRIASLREARRRVAHGVRFSLNGSARGPSDVTARGGVHLSISRNVEPGRAWQTNSMRKLHEPNRADIFILAGVAGIDFRTAAKVLRGESVSP